MRTWIFQANPDKYRINNSLESENEEFWNLNQHKDKVSVGDRVLIWISGTEAGIYAIGTVMSPPVLMSDSLTGQSYWIPPSDGRIPKLRVRVRYDRILKDPLGKAFLLADLRLRNLSILRSWRATNFIVTDDEWSAIQDFL